MIFLMFLSMGVVITSIFPFLSIYAIVGAVVSWELGNHARKKAERERLERIEGR